MQTSNLYLDSRGADITNGVFFDGKTWIWAGPQNGGIIWLSSPEKMVDSSLNRKVWCSAKFEEFELCNGKIRFLNSEIDLGSEYIIDLLHVELLQEKSQNGTVQKTAQLYIRIEGVTGVWIFNVETSVSKN